MVTIKEVSDEIFGIGGKKTTIELWCLYPKGEKDSCQDPNNIRPKIKEIYYLWKEMENSIIGRIGLLRKSGIR